MASKLAGGRIALERRHRRALAVVALILPAWTLVALIFSAQGYAISLYRGRPQPWWPSFGYSLAIFSIWALLTAPLVAIARRIETSTRPLRVRLSIYLLGLPMLAAAHVLLFALIYWPLYNDGGRLPTRWAMGERMFLSNLDTNTLFYALIIGAVAAHRGWERRRPEPASDSPPAPFQVRSKGRTRLISIADIEWIGAAGNYAELHVGAETHLLDESLASLERRLPRSGFARIHRGAIVRLADIEELKSVGRGDAVVRLRSGAELRLSRRYRSNLEAWLGKR